MDIQWPLVLFTMFAGCGAGLLAYCGASEFYGTSTKSRWKISMISCILIIVGGFFSVLHLAQPSNIMWAAQHIGSFSGVSMEMIFLVITVVLSFIYFLLTVRKTAKSTVLSKIIAVLCVIGGVLFCFVLGNGYVLPAREAWDSTGLPLAYLGTNLAMGALLFCALCSLFKEQITSTVLKVLVTIGVVLGIIFCAIYALLKGAELTALTSSTIFLVLCLVFCAIAAVFGFLLLRKFKGTGGFATCAWIGFIFAVAGALMLRLLMWNAGVSTFDAFGYPDGILLFD